MRYALSLLMLLHGLIHLLGFAKAVGARSLPIQTAISKPVGVAWLSASLLMCAAAATLLSGSRSWWLPAAVGVLLSEALILGAFRDAKSGSLPNLIIALALVATWYGYDPTGVGANRYQGSEHGASASHPALALAPELRPFAGPKLASRPDAAPPSVGLKPRHAVCQWRPAQRDLQKGSSL